jgi:hypothetical protein
MSTSCTVGFARKSDLSDYKGIYVHYDGYPRGVIPSIAYFIHFFGFSELVKQLKVDTAFKGWHTPIEVLKTGKILEAFPTDKIVVTRDDINQYDYAYVIKSPTTIHMYKHTKTPTEVFKLKLDWLQISKKMIDYLFDQESSSVRPIDDLLIKPIELELKIK